MELLRIEQETIVLFNEAEATASVYTHNRKLREKLERMARKFPDKVALERRSQAGAVSYLVPKAVFPFGSRTATSAGPPTGNGP